MRAVLIGLALTFTSSLAFCQTPSEPEAAAEALFRAGRAAALEGNHALACKRFSESQRLAPAVGTLLNMGICEEHLGRFVEAWQHYHAVIDALPADDRRRAIAQQKLKELDPRLPRLVLQRAPGAPASTVVRLGSVTLEESSFGVPIPIGPGVHRLVASAPGRRPRTYEQNLVPGSRSTLFIEPGSPVPVAPPKPRTNTPKPSRSAWPVVGYSLLGAGVAGFLVSGVTALMARDRDATVDEECEGPVCSARGLEARDQGKALVRWCTVGFVVGALGAASGTAIIIHGGTDQTNANFRGVSARMQF